MMYTKEMQTRHNKVNKPKKINHKRNKPRLRDRGRVSPEVYAQAYEAAGGRCERCRWKDGTIDPIGIRWRLEAAHGVRRRHLEETTADDIIFLCGPQTQTGTCHNWVDHTREGREWMIEHMEQRKKRREKDVG